MMMVLQQPRNMLCHVLTLNDVGDVMFSAYIQLLACVGSDYVRYLSHDVARSTEV